MEKHEEEIVDELPKLLKSWTRVYIIVISELLVLILFFYLFTQAYS